MNLSRDVTSSFVGWPVIQVPEMGTRAPPVAKLWNNQWRRKSGIFHDVSIDLLLDCGLRTEEVFVLHMQISAIPRTTSVLLWSLLALYVFLKSSVCKGEIPHQWGRYDCVGAGVNTPNRSVFPMQCCLPPFQWHSAHSREDMGRRQAFQLLNN